MKAAWKQRPEGGGLFALWLIRTIGRHAGRRVSRMLLYPITLYFLVRRRPERMASRSWLTRAMGRPATLLDVARHIHTFASTILDRVFLLSGQMRAFKVEVSGVETIHDYVDAGRGLLLFGSHLGSFEVLRVLSRKRPDIPLRVVLDKAHNPALTQLLDALNPDIAATVIDAGQDGPSIMLAIGQAIEEGAIVALLVDRVLPGDPSIAVPFLGGEARLPTAPWMIAAVLGAPVMLAFGLYRGGNRYDLVFEPFSDAVQAPRPQRKAILDALIRRYAARLEHYARQAPFNWFNFYDFWEDAHHDTQRDDAVARRTHRDTATPSGPGPAGDGDAAVVRDSGAARRA